MLVVARTLAGSWLKAGLAQVGKLTSGKQPTNICVNMPYLTWHVLSVIITNLENAVVNTIPFNAETNTDKMPKGIPYHCDSLSTWFTFKFNILQQICDLSNTFISIYLSNMHTFSSFLAERQQIRAKMPDSNECYSVKIFSQFTFLASQLISNLQSLN